MHRQCQQEETVMIKPPSMKALAAYSQTIIAVSQRWTKGIKKNKIGETCWALHKVAGESLQPRNLRYQSKTRTSASTFLLLHHQRWALLVYLEGPSPWTSSMQCKLQEDWDYQPLHTKSEKMPRGTAMYLGVINSERRVQMEGAYKDHQVRGFRVRLEISIPHWGLFVFSLQCQNRQVVRSRRIQAFDIS